MKTYIGDSKLGGKGTFAKEDIGKNENIMKLGGEKITIDETHRRIEKGEENYDDPLGISESHFLDLDEKSR